MGKMLITTRKRLVAAGTGLLLLAGMGLVGPVGQAAAASTPTITFSPAGPFRGGESVSVTVAGLVPTDRVLVAQCAPGQKPHPMVAAAGCSGMTAPLVQATTSSVTVPITVAEGFVGPEPKAVCNTVNDCFFVARITAQGSSDPSTDTFVSTKIPFTYSWDGGVPSGPPAVSYSPSGALTAGTLVTVSVTGMTPNAPVVIAQCAQNRVVLGPRDCAPPSRGAARLITVDGAGNGRASLTLLVGPLLNENAPATVCSSTDACKLVAINIANQDQSASRPIAISSAAIVPEVGISLTKKSVKKSKPTTFKGLVGPNQAGQHARLQKKVGKKWVTVKKARLSMASRYAITLRPTSRKDYYWRVLLPKTKYHKAAHSKPKKLKVR